MSDAFLYTAVDKVVVTLRQEMLEGILLPGTQLREEKISQRFGVSRSTVREAIRVLTMDGLATRMPNRSVTVHHLTLDEIEDIYTARLVLERASVQAAESCPESTLTELMGALATYEAAAHSGNVPQAADAHVEFHARMVRILTGSSWLEETERSLLRHLLLILASVHKSAADLRAEMNAHRTMVDLCAARRVTDGLALLEAELLVSKASAVKYSFEAQLLAESGARSPLLKRSAAGGSMRATGSVGGPGR